jgi:hypothetical protein
LEVPQTPLILVENLSKGLISYFKNYRDSRFTFVLISEQIAIEMEIESIFRRKYIIHRNKQLDKKY